MTSVITKGRNVSICEKFLSKDELSTISTIICDTLKECINSQIFIELSLVEALKKSGLLCRRNYMKGFHYGDNNDMFYGEQPFKFVNSDCIIFLVSNSKGYMQVSEFRTKGKSINYTHYIQGISNVVFISEEVTQESSENP